VRGPLADALARDELPDDLFVRELVELRELELAGQDVLGQGAQRGGLGA
jgi:hypothetical protein